MTNATALFKTSDLQRAATLDALGHAPLRVEGPADGRIFVFEDVPADVLAAYDTPNLPVTPGTLFRSYRHLKRLLFAR